MQKSNFLPVFFSSLILFLFNCSVYPEEIESNDSTRIVGTEEQVTVIGRTEDLIGIASSASEGRVGSKEIEDRPLLKTGEVLEVIPGLVVSQHSGSGKANQYYLRGFNLDHGTDFATKIDGMPINMPTHGHGQGYTDLNFLIPEVIDYIGFKKGPYYADQGDFSSAGAASIATKHSLNHGIASIQLGDDYFSRGLVADSSKQGNAELLYAVDVERYEGPWENDEDLRKFKGLLRYGTGTDTNGASVSAMAYHGDWNSTDQIPERAVSEGNLSRLGTVDPSDGGAASRYSLSGDWRQSTANANTKANLYAIYSRLNLFSNFTYFLDDPINGDQFEQVDKRTVLGGEIGHEWNEKWAGYDVINNIGFQTRHDIIPEVALRHTKEQSFLSTVRSDDVKESSAGIYASNEISWTEKFRSVAGLRGDLYYFDVESDQSLNSGNDTDQILSPKLGLVFGPWSDTEYYISTGTSFHSNDARGTTINVDPNDPNTPASKVDPLVRSKGGEVGIRTSAIENLNSTLALWILDLDSELLFVGDAGTTDVGRPSRRYGVEFANYYQLNELVALDADLSLSKAKFRDSEIEGDEIPGSIESVLATGISFGYPTGLFSSLRGRYFGPRPLIEDDSVRSNSSFLVNAELGYKLQKHKIALEILNLFDRKVSDIDYFYTSRLPGEPSEGIDDIHFHPAQPITARLAFTANF